MRPVRPTIIRKPHNEIEDSYILCCLRSNNTRAAVAQDLLSIFIFTTNFSERELNSVYIQPSMQPTFMVFEIPLSPLRAYCDAIFHLLLLLQDFAIDKNGEKVLSKIVR